MKRTVISVSAVVLSILLGVFAGVYHNTQLADSDKRVYAQASVSYQDFDTVLEEADVIVSGTIESIEQRDTYDEYTVVVDDVKKGDADERISVRNYLYEYSYSIGEVEKSGCTNVNYEEGGAYIFVLQHIKNVYQDIFMILADTYISLDATQESTVLSEGLDAIDDCAEYIDQYHFQDETGKGDEISLAYIESDQQDVILEESPYIARIMVRELSRATEVSDVYICDVVETLKGNLTTTEDGQILIPFFTDTVEVGGTYIVCLNSDTDDSIIYALSSHNSVMEVSQQTYIQTIIEEQ